MTHNIPCVAAVILAAVVMASASADSDIAAREQAAKTVTAAFVKELGNALNKHMSEAGPVEAIKVCREIAPTVANNLSLKHGWKVTRVGTRVRNTMIGIPDEWEQVRLTAFQERADKDEAFSEMTYAGVVAEGNRRYFRFMKPIGVKPLCLNCHGGPDEIPAAVQTLLNEQYPHDQAVGYSVGELRGAVSIKQPLD